MNEIQNRVIDETHERAESSILVEFSCPSMQDIRALTDKTNSVTSTVELPQLTLVDESNDKAAVLQDVQTGFEKGGDSGPELNSSARIEWLMNRGRMFDANGQFTPEAIQAIAAYIEHGTLLFNFRGADGRAAHVQQLLNARYATGFWENTQPGHAARPEAQVWRPPTHFPFTVSQRPAAFVPNGSQAGGTHYPFQLTIGQTVNGTNRIVYQSPNR